MCVDFFFGCCRRLLFLRVFGCQVLSTLLRTLPATSGQRATTVSTSLSVGFTFSNLGKDCRHRSSEQGIIGQNDFPLCSQVLNDAAILARLAPTQVW